MTQQRDLTIHMIGHGHIDPTWLWRWTEGYEEVRATFRSALDRMKEYPDFKFTSSSACFYAWVKEVDPEMFEEIKARVAEGRWDVAGGWWIEPDCNVPGGESFARHGLYSQRFFEKELGVRAKVGFNPDSFGHAGTFPQFYKKIGIDYYVYMRPEPFWERQYPGGSTFWWQANDGTRILTHCLLWGYNGSREEVERKLQELPKSQYLNPGQRHLLGFYGVGNHGGGPTKAAIDEIIKTQKKEDAPKIEFSTLESFFDGFESTMDLDSLPLADSDLQHHARGCYSVHAEIKRLNRRAEHALMQAERFATLLWLTEGRSYPAAQLERSWRDVLYNQFHDILAGTSLQISYEDSRDQYGRAIHTAHEIFNESMQRLARSIDTSAEGNTILVVNPLPWPVKTTVTAPNITERELEKPFHIVDDANAVVPSQNVLGERVGHTAYAFTADVPAMGYRCYHARSGKQAAKLQGMLEAGRDFLENDRWRIEFDPYGGHIARLFDKKNNVELMKQGNVLAAMVDQSDTWSHGYDEWRVEAGRFGSAALELLEFGDVRATVRVTSKFRQSTVDQFVTIHRNTDDIDCTFRVNWQEQYTMLKLAYETRIEAGGTATYDTAYGCQERNTQGFEEPGQKWFDLTGTVAGAPYGLAVLNDSKYGFDVRDGVMRVTLLRSPAYAHHDRTRFKASEPFPIMDQGWHTIKIRLVPHAGTWQDAGVVRKSWELNELPVVHVESGHKGTLPQKASFLSTPADNVVLTVLKKSEDGDDIVIRGYETAGREANTTIEMPHLKKSYKVTFTPHEIKTIRIAKDSKTATEVNLLEE